MAALLLGHRPPDLSRPFRWAELGSGHGFSASVFASAFPQAEFWGFDFNPAHVESARLTASRAGLSNVHFEEASFAELAARGDAALPEFDFVVGHGIYSWVSRENQRHILDFFRRRLRPGGLGYLGYNALPGWASMLPVRALMHRWWEAHPGRPEQSVPAMLAFLQRLKESGAAFMAANPMVDTRLAALANLDPRYIVHEYLNKDWSPLMSADVADDLAEAKCAFIGSATLTDNLDAAAVPPVMQPLLADIRETRLRETLKDLGSAQSFRRDIFRRGLDPLGGPEHRGMLDELELVGVGRAPEGEVNFSTAIGQVTGKREIYAPLLERLADGRLSLREARGMEALADKPMKEAAQAFALLASGGYAHPAAAAASPAFAQALNVEIARRMDAGQPLTWLVAPGIGTAMPADVIDIALAGEVLAGRLGSAETLIERAMAMLAATGRAVLRDGQAVTDPAQARVVVGEVTAAFLEKRLPLYRRLGALPG
jgi:SAM-dependent methyltransferase